MKFTKTQFDKLRYRYLQHTGSIEEIPQQINFEPQKIKRNELKSETWVRVSKWLDECVRQTENN